MYKLLTKNGQMFAFGLGVLVSLIFLVSVFSGIENFNGLGKEDQYASTIFNFGIYAVIALTILTVVIMVVAGIYHLASDPAGLKKTGPGLAVVIIIFFVARAMATAETGERWTALYDKFNITGGTETFIDASITTALAMAGIAAAAFILSEIRNFFK